MPSIARRITELVVTETRRGDPQAKPNTFVRDTGLAGFAVLIGRTRSSYVVEARAGRTGRNVRITLGTVGKLALEDARTQAKDKIAALANGR
jgi:hypothetical protein